MKIPTGISPNYVKGWDITKAIREIIQNYLDSRKEFNCNGYISWKNGRAVVKDLGPGLQLRHLALGISEKGMDSIGKYGEGLKLALLVMAREGRDIEVWANGQIIRPRIEIDEGYQTEVMVLYVDPMRPCDAKTHKGTSIKFQCSREELEAGKSYFEFFQTQQRSNFEWVEKDKISLPGGHIYVNGSRVGSIPDALYSYHLQEREVGDVGNRDREVVDRNKVESVVRGMLSRTSSTKVMKGVLQAIIQHKDVWEARVGLHPWVISQPDIRRIWRRVFNTIAGEKAVVSTGNPGDDVQAEYRGYKVINVDYFQREILKAIGIKDSLEAVVGASKGLKKVAPKHLREEERANLKKARKLVEKYYAPVGSVSIMSNMKDMACGTYGIYNPEEDRIYLHQSILGDLPQTLHTLLHETVHKHSRADDCSAAFEKALTDVAVNIMLKLGK